MISGGDFNRQTQDASRAHTVARGQLLFSSKFSGSSSPCAIIDHMDAPAGRRENFHMNFGAVTGAHGHFRECIGRTPWMQERCEERKKVS